MLIAIVGKANVGKSTFFKAATLSEVLIANYPFATIKPNTGVGYVKVDCAEKFFNVKCNPKEGFCIKGKRFVPIELLDVAGLVPGAHEGRGLGNQFLDDLGTADVLIHVVDMSGTTDSDGKPCENYDPCKDIEFLEEEIDCWFTSILLKSWKKFAKRATLESKDEDRVISEQFSGLKVSLSMVKNVRHKVKIDKKLRDWTEEEIKKFAKELRKISKPIIIAANKCDKSSFEENYKRAKEKFPDLMIIPCSAESELALREAAKHELIEYVPGEDEFEIKGELNEKQKKGLNLVKENVLKKWKSTGVQDCLNKAVFDFLNYVYIFPGGVNKLSDSKGNVLPDCFLMPPKSTALDFAYRLHSDFGNNFIKAINVKKKLPVGKDYELKRGDVIEIISKK